MYQGNLFMKRFLATALVLGLMSPLGLVGCSDKAKVETTETIKTPGGQTETTKSTEVKSSGENPPPNSAGETAKTAP